MKRIAALMLVMVMLVAVTGCGNEITLNSKENDLVAEYIGGEMLEYAEHNKWNYQKLNATLNLMPQQPTTAAGNQTQVGTQEQTKPSADSNNKATEADTKPADEEVTTSGDVMTDLASALGISGVSIAYKDYVKCDVYPEEKYSLGVRADSGYDLFVFTFRLINNTDKDMVVNTYNSGVSFKLGVGDTTILQTGTIMQNDLIIMQDEQISKEGVYYAIAVFQVPEAYASSTDLTLTAYKSGKEIGKVPGL